MDFKESKTTFYSDSAIFNIDVEPPAFTIRIDIIAIIMFFVAVSTRMWLLEEPKSIVYVYYLFFLFVY